MVPVAHTEGGYLTDRCPYQKARFQVLHHCGMKASSLEVGSVFDSVPLPAPAEAQQAGCKKVASSTMLLDTTSGPAEQEGSLAYIEIRPGPLLA